jgi:hypothetical protein
VKGGAQTTDSGLVTKGTGAGGEQFNLDCGGAGHGFRFFVRDIAGSAHVASSSVVPNNQWQHVVGVCDQARSNVTLYVDGVSAATASITPGSGLLGSSNPVSIGCRQSGTTAYDLQFAGYIQEVAIYGYALSAAQIKAHFMLATNRAPVFVANPISRPAATAGSYYSVSLVASAADPNGDAVTYSKAGGPAWLTVGGSGLVYGTPARADIGDLTFGIRASDPAGLNSTGTLTLTVLAPPDLVAALALQGANLLLTWSGGISPYTVQMSTNLAAPDWQNVSGNLTATSLTVPRTNAAAFYRILSQ